MGAIAMKVRGSFHRTLGPALVVSALALSYTACDDDKTPTGSTTPTATATAAPTATATATARPTATTAPTNPGAPYDAGWTGTTDNGNAISMNVFSNKIQRFTMDFTLRAGCNVTVTG